MRISEFSQGQTEALWCDVSTPTLTTTAHDNPPSSAQPSINSRTVAVTLMATTQVRMGGHVCAEQEDLTQAGSRGSVVRGDVPVED